MKSRYTGIDICRLALAGLIPLLHISLPDSLPLYIVRQYVSRLGVPFSLQYRECSYQKQLLTGEIWRQ